MEYSFKKKFILSYLKGIYFQTKKTKLNFLFMILRNHMVV